MGSCILVCDAPLARAGSPFSAPSSVPAMPQSDPAPRHLAAGSGGSASSPRLAGSVLVAIGLLYGSCGGALSGLHVTLMTSEEACRGAWSDQLLCDPDVTWAVSTLVCVVVPVALHALLLPQLRGRRRDRCLVGAVSVLAAVVVTFGCWRLLLDVSLLWAGWGYLAVRYGIVVLMGVL